MFGLSVESDIRLPSLVYTERRDVDVCVQEVASSGAPLKTGLRFLSQDSVPQSIEIGFENSIDIEIRPDRVSYRRWDCTDDRIIGHLLTDWALPLSLVLRGTPAFHGAAIRLTNGHGACLICGASGAGKSTLSLELSRRGYPKLADDVAALRLDPSGVFVEPGVGHSKLLIDALDRLAVSPEGLEPVSNKADKYIFPTALWLSPEPVTCIVELTVQPCERVEIEMVNGPERFSVLDRHTIGTKLMRAGNLRALHLDWLRRVAHIPVYRLRRPAGVESLSSVVDCLELIWAKEAKPRQDRSL